MPVRWSIASTTVDASVSASTSFSAPPKRPTGVRTGLQITASRIESLLHRAGAPPIRSTGAGLPRSHSRRFRRVWLQGAPADVTETTVSEYGSTVYFQAEAGPFESEM